MGVFFTPTLAVTCDHNLTDDHSVGSSILLALKNEVAHVEVARNPDLDIAILKASQPRSIIPPWNGRPDELQGRYDLGLASFRLGNDHPEFRTSTISISPHRRHIMHPCPAYAGDSAAALIIKDEFLVGIHHETTHALHEQIERNKISKDRLTDVEEYQGNV
ncbi:Crinkler (CRN), partial [Phytophthora megakarya]